MQLVLVERARLEVAVDVRDADQRADVHQPDQDEEGAGRERSDEPERVLQGRAVVLDRVDQGTHAEGQQQRQPEDHARVAEREPEAGAERAGALADELARGVVDDRDVVGVERVARTEEERGQTDADSEDARVAEAELLRRHGEQQDTPAEDVEPDHRRHQADQCPPVAGFSASRVHRRGRRGDVMVGHPPYLIANDLQQRTPGPNPGEPACPKPSVSPSATPPPTSPSPPTPRATSTSTTCSRRGARSSSTSTRPR